MRNTDCCIDHLDDSENCTYVRENETQRVYQCKLCKEYFYYPKQTDEEAYKEGLEDLAERKYSRSEKWMEC